MSSKFTLEFLQDKMGAEYLEKNPVTGKPRIIQGLNEVWAAINEHGGVQWVAKLFGLSELVVWGWVDSHYVPDPYARYLAHPEAEAIELQMPSLGYEDPESGACWPLTWRLTCADIDARNDVRNMKRAVLDAIKQKGASNALW